MRLKHNYFFLKAMALLLLTGTVFLISCASEKNSGQIIHGGKTASIEDKKIDTDYSGIYRLSDTLICDLVITITKKGDDYIYTVKGSSFKSSGKLSVENKDEQTYMNFNRTLRSGDNSTVTGAYSDDRITIQNYGNSLNQYICFKACNSKYLEFVKVR